MFITVSIQLALHKKTQCTKSMKPCPLSKLGCPGKKEVIKPGVRLMCMADANVFMACGTFMDHVIVCLEKSSIT